MPLPANFLAGATSILSVASAISGCGQILGVDKYGVVQQPPETTKNAACGLPYGTTACASCARTKCCDEAKACAGNAACNDYETCLGACRQGDMACRAQCGIDHPAGTAPEVSALSACLVTNCETDCGLTCGALAGWAVEPDAAAPFQTCMASNCDAVRACASSAECDAATRCFVACPANDCIDTCLASHGADPAWWLPDATVSDATATFIGFARARTACAADSGNYWECVGHVSWPSVQVAKTNIQTVVKFSVAGPTDLSGIDVEACGDLDVNCGTPWGSGQTDGAGRVSFDAQASGEGYLKVISPTTVDSYNYWGFPLTHARYVFGPGRSGYATTGISIFTTDRWNALARSVAGADGGTADPNRGTVMVVVEDCLAAIAPDVEVTLSTVDSPPTVFTVNGSRTGNVTDSTGALVFANVPLGHVWVTAIPRVLGTASGTVEVTARLGITLVNLRPTPPRPL